MLYLTYCWFYCTQMQTIGGRWLNKTWALITKNKNKVTKSQIRKEQGGDHPWCVTEETSGEQKDMGLYTWRSGEDKELGEINYRQTDACGEGAGRDKWGNDKQPKQGPNWKAAERWRNKPKQRMGINRKPEQSTEINAAWT